VNFGRISFGVKPSFTKNFITAQYSILSILRNTYNTPASGSCIKQTTGYNDLQFHMDAYDRCASLLTPWSRGILEKLTGSQLVEKFPAFYDT
jgi:hypothetical protein